MLSMRSRQRASQTAKLIIQCLGVGVFSLFVSGCRSQNPTPEVLDPIFADLNQRSSVAKAAAEGAKADITSMRDELAALPPRDPTRRKLLQDLSKKELQFVVAEQDALYFEIRAQQRKDYARDEYLKAFNAGKDWPDPKDFEAYKLQRKLAESPREWNNRVPKTDRYNRKTEADIRKDLEAKTKAASPGGGHH